MLEIKFLFIGQKNLFLTKNEVSKTNKINQNHVQFFRKGVGHSEKESS